MRLFFSVRFWLSANRGRFTPAKTRSLMKKIWSSSKSQNRSIFERGTASDYFSSSYEPRAKSSNYAYGDAEFWAGHLSEDCGLVPRSAWLISSVYRSKTNMNAKKVKIARDKSEPHRKRPERSRISSKLILASCVWYFDRSYYEFYVTSQIMYGIYPVCFGFDAYLPTLFVRYLSTVPTGAVQFFSKVVVGWGVESS